MPRILVPILSLLAFLAAAAASHAQGASGGGAKGPTEVGTVTLETSEVPYSVLLPGRAVAYESTDIRPRVEGIVEEIPYTPGRRVEIGAVLFRLSSDSAEAALAAAEAAKESADAAVRSATAVVERARKLMGVGSTAADLEADEAALAQAKATLKSAEASLRTAQLGLDRLEIRSPIAGIAGLPEVSVGALVTANQSTALTTVTRIDPIYVDVSESSARMLANRDRMETGDLKIGQDIDVTLTLETGETYADKGRFVSPGIAVSTTTGTVNMRFEFDNPQRRILPGQFLRVMLTLGTSKAILVPQRATDRQSDGTLTAFIVRDGKAALVTLSYTGTYQNAWVVTSGVEPGDLLIVDGLNNLRAGAAVKPVPVTIGSDGVVTDVAPAAADAASGGGAAAPAGGDATKGN